jgi:hypothetical protein
VDSVQFIMAVWGEAYTDLFLSVTLPNHLSAGNLGMCRTRPERCILKILTTSPDAEVISAAPVLGRVRDLLDVEIVRIDDVDLTDKWGAMSEFHRRAVVAAANEDAALVFLGPDAIWGDGSLAHAIEAAASGKRAVMVMGLRAVKETFLPWYERHFPANEAHVATISCRELVGATLEHLHPQHTWGMWGAGAFTRVPSHIYFPVEDKGLVARCLHLHPLVVIPRDRSVVPRGTIDGDYMGRAGLLPSDFHFLNDSDQAFSCDITRRDYLSPPPPGRASVDRIAGWAWRNTNAAHRRYIGQRMLVHSEDLDAQWQMVSAESDRVVDAILTRLESTGPERLLRVAQWVLLDWRGELRRAAVRALGEERVARLRGRLRSQLGV